jgi:hypothetical protein
VVNGLIHRFRPKDDFAGFQDQTLPAEQLTERCRFVVAVVEKPSSSGNNNFGSGQPAILSLCQGLDLVDRRMRRESLAFQPTEGLRN